MTVKQLIKFLEYFPEDTPVAYELYSDYSLLNPEDIKLRELCIPRNDGWIESDRPDKVTTIYLVFPGN